MRVSSGFLPNIFVMTFSINGIKQDKIEKFNVEMLLCVEAPLVARKVLEQKNILLLSFKEYEKDNASFGDIYFTMKLGFEDVDIVTKFTDPQQACNFFIFIGFDITQINSYSAPISPEVSTEMIKKAKIEAQQKQMKIKEEMEKQKAQTKEIYIDDNLQSAKTVVLKVLEKVATTIKRSAKMIPIMEMKKINAMVETLRKQRMGTNLEKIKDTIKEMLEIIEKIDTARYQSIDTSGTNIDPESLVTSFDVNQEIERMETVNILKSLHMKLPLNKQTYIIMGPNAMLLKFIKKDLLYKFSDILSLLYSLYDITEFVFLIILVLLGAYTVANDRYLFFGSQLGLNFSLITIGIR